MFVCTLHGYYTAYTKCTVIIHNVSAIFKLSEY